MKIGELAHATDTKVETIRYYEGAGLLAPPARTGGNYRSYGTDELLRLSFIRRARDLGFSLDEVALADDRDQPCSAVDAVASGHLATIERKIADLSRMRDELARIIGGCRLGNIGDCKIIATLGPMRSIAPDVKMT